MINDIKINIGSLEEERFTVIATYKKMLEDFSHIKALVEKVGWYDEQYDKLIDSLNTIAFSLSNAIYMLTNGYNVYAVDELIHSAESYLNTQKAFPKI